MVLIQVPIRWKPTAHFLAAAWWLFSLLVVVAGARPVDGAGITLEPSTARDTRLGTLRALRDTYHPWKPPETLSQWETTAEQIRRRILVSNGLWPMWPRPAIEATIHGKQDLGDYTIEKVFFASLPGVYVTGSLYRPTTGTGPYPGVLCPHGHWANGRFYDAGAEAARDQIAQGAEVSLDAARSPLQARAVHLARMGCVVFFYDMIGYADSKPLEHRGGFLDAEAGLRLQNIMGLQTFNSIRALDFLTSLPDVDGQRIGVTGASGGGTQTFILGAVDPRPTVAFPAVMVSTNMQGGCVCENADYLRIGVNNVAFAALFAPKPLAMSGADDWTIDIETRGLPELRRVYGLYDQADRVQARCFPQFKHNYNLRARQMMYGWFNEYLRLGHDPVPAERPFARQTADELTVFTESHPQPQDAAEAMKVRQTLTQMAGRQLDGLLDAARDDWQAYRDVVGAATRVMLGGPRPDSDSVEVNLEKTQTESGTRALQGTLSRHGSGEAIPFLALVQDGFHGKVVVWLHPDGRRHLLSEGQPSAAVGRLLAAGYAVVGVDVFQTGALVTGNGAARAMNDTYSGYTLGYNRPVLAERVRDILTTVAAARKVRSVREVHIVGTGGAGLWAVLAAGQAGTAVESCLADLDGFCFSTVESTSDENYLPGALKYGDVGGLAALAFPTPLTLAGVTDEVRATLEPLKAAYDRSAGALELRDTAIDAAQVVEALLARP